MLNSKSNNLSQLSNNHMKFETFQDKLNYSLEVLRKTFEDYRPEQLFISFNGGKDCTVLLHMVNNFLNSNNISTGINIRNILCIYFQPKNPFEEVEEFIEECQQDYQIIIRAGIEDKKFALQTVCDEYPEILATIMGSRRTDPYCQDLNSFEETSKGWPPLMRISPLLDWTCADIWQYLHTFKVPYCSLYEKGYTSLGDKTNTLPNPHLKYLNEDTNEVLYRPAYELIEKADELERVGRFTTTPTDQLQ